MLSPVLLLLAPNDIPVVDNGGGPDDRDDLLGLVVTEVRGLRELSLFEPTLYHAGYLVALLLHLCNQAWEVRPLTVYYDVSHIFMNLFLFIVIFFICYRNTIVIII